MLTDASLSWLEIFLRVGFALCAGTIIGLEREISNHPAGMRTHALVCIGAALSSMITCQMGFEIAALGQEQVRVDISRIAAGVVGAVGFLGAGTIIKMRRNSVVVGLTTAATLWVTACLGLSIGMGYFKISFAVLAAALIVTISFKYLEHKMTALKGIIDVDVTFINHKEMTEFIFEYCDTRLIQVVGIKYLGNKDETDEKGNRLFRHRYTLKLPRGLTLATVLRDWNMQDSVIMATKAVKRADREEEE